MGSTAAIMWREINARRDLFWLALAVAVLVTLLPFMPGLEGQSVKDVWDTASTFFAMALGYILAIGLGAITFGSDLSESRLGFFFARPVNGVAVRVGRMLGAYTVILACQVLILTPLLFVQPENIGLLLRYGWWGIVPMVAGPALVLLAAHAMSVMFRARTAWLILDLLAPMAAAVVLWMTLRPLVLQGTPDSVWAVSTAFVAAAIAALGVAGTAGVVFGRTDLRRVHGALSLTLWLAATAAWAGAAHYGSWVNGFGPLDLGNVWVTPVDPTGEWVVVEGEAPGRFDIERCFLVSSTDDRYITLPHRLRLSSWRTRHPEFSMAGDTAAWLADGSSEGSLTLWWVDLSAGDLEPFETTITTPDHSELVLSEDGSRVLFTAPRQLLSVYDLADEKLISMTRLPPELRDPGCHFASEDVVRCYTSSRDWRKEKFAWRIAEFDIGSGEAQLTGKIDMSDEVRWPFFVANSNNLLTERSCPGEDCRLELRNPRTGTLEREVPLPDWVNSAALLSDGRVVARAGDWRQTTAVAVQRSDTGEWIEHQFGEDSGYVFWGEASPGHLYAINCDRDPGASGERCGFDEFDLENGESRRVPADVTPSYFQRSLQNQFWSSSVPTDSNPSIWHPFRDTRGALVRWDFETNELITIAGGAE